MSKQLSICTFCNQVATWVYLNNGDFDYRCDRHKHDNLYGPRLPGPDEEEPDELAYAGACALCEGVKDYATGDDDIARDGSWER